MEKMSNPKYCLPAKYINTNKAFHKYKQKQRKPFMECYQHKNSKIGDDESFSTVKSQCHFDKT